MNYYNEIKNLIEEREINKKVRELKDNREDLLARWNIGKLLVEAQGGIKRAKYGSYLIKKWGEKFKNVYGSNYSDKNLRSMRQYYLCFPIWNAVPSELQRLPTGDERIADSHSKLPIGEVRPTSLNVEPALVCSKKGQFYWN